MVLKTLKTIDCVLKRCVVKTSAPEFGVDPIVQLSWCRKGDLNPHELKRSQGPQPCASTNSAIPTDF